jgi:hypothetical protein
MAPILSPTVACSPRWVSKDSIVTNTWPLVWSHGHGSVQAVGGMLGPVHFRLPDGRSIQPFAVFPWADEPLPPDQAALTGLMSRGRGEWPCVPFGHDLDPLDPSWNPPIHGEAAHGRWQRIDDGEDDGRLRLVYHCGPAGPVASLERHLSGVTGQPAIDCRLIVRVRRHCTLPIGLHPTLRVPARPGALTVHPGPFSFGLTYPREVEPGADVLACGKAFTELAAVPRQDGRTIDLTSFPLRETTESLVQLCGIDGRVDVVNVDEAYCFSVRWNPALLPSCVLWVSNAGRSAWPWSGRHYALGVEPVCAAFDLGVSVSANENAISAGGIPTALSLHPDFPLEIDYRLSVSAADQQGNAP